MEPLPALIVALRPKRTALPPEVLPCMLMFPPPEYIATLVVLPPNSIAQSEFLFTAPVGRTKPAASVVVAVPPPTIIAPPPAS